MPLESAQHGWVFRPETYERQVVCLGYGIVVGAAGDDSSVSLNQHAVAASVQGGTGGDEGGVEYT
jgi:hypothetical protein